MRIVYIAAGAGNMRCGACARDLTLIRGLSRRGHQVRVIPLYTPLRDDAAPDGKPFPTAPIFYGGINAYLQQVSPAFARAPRFVARLLDRPALLNWASSFAVKTTPADLGPMTVSVLAGQDGRQQRELSKLLDFIREEPAPDVINLTNSLLSGIAPALKQQLGTPVVCSLQGEDEFVSSMPQQFADEARRLMRNNARSIDLFLAPGHTYAARMAEFLDVPADKIHVVRTGVEAVALSPSPCTQGEGRGEGVRAGSMLGSTTPPRDCPNPLPEYRARGPEAPFVVGYLSVITPGKGLDLLIDAVRQLAAAGRDIRLRIAGQALDKSYWKHISAALAAPELAGRTDYLGELAPAAKAPFFASCHVFVLPSRFAEARGLAAMEAMAAGTPALLPDAGIFPELIEITGGGRLFRRNDAADLATQLAALMDNPNERRQLGLRAADGIRRFFSADDMAATVDQLFQSLARH